MAREPLTREEAEAALRAWRDAGRNLEAGSRALGIAKSTMRCRLRACTRDRVELEDGTVSPVPYRTSERVLEPGWWRGGVRSGGVSGILGHGVDNGHGESADTSARRVEPGVEVRQEADPLGLEAPDGCEHCGAVPNAERVRMQDELRTLRAELRGTHRDNVSAEEVREAIFGLSAQELRPPEWLSEPLGDARSPGVPTLLLSDLHWGEVVNREEMRGVNEYSVEIARARLRRVVRSTIELCLVHTAAPEYPGIVVALGGDMVSGGIHEELADTDDLPAIPASVDCAEHLIAALRLLAEAFGRVFVPCVDGNHDRDGKHIRYKGRAQHSYGWLIYQMLEREFRNDDRIVFQISAENDVVYELAGRRYLLTHGDQIGARGGDGIIGALGPIRRGAIKLAGQYAALGLQPDTTIMGHWHQAITLRDIIVNNTLKGWDEYARQALRAPASTPSQVLWWTHPDYGITKSCEVFAEKPPTREAQEWCKWIA